MRKRNNRIHLYLTDNELNELDKKVSACNVTREKYMRMLLNGYCPREAPPVDYYELICEVRRVGANINQLLKVANSIGILDVPKIRSVLEETRATEQMLWNAFAPGKA